MSQAANLGDGPAPSLPQVFRRELERGTTRRVSRAQGVAGADAQGVGDTLDLTSDGACVAFEARGDLLGASPLSLAVFMRTFAPACTMPVEQPPGGGDPPGDGPPPGDSDPPGSGDPPRGGGAGGGDPPGDDGPTSPGHDRTAPRVRLLAATATRAGTHRTPLRVQLRLTSSEAGLLRVRFERVRPGRTVRHGQRRSCRATLRPVRRGYCRAFTSFAVLTRAIAPGTTRLVLRARIGRRQILPGAYRLTATVRDAAGNLSAPQVRPLGVVRVAVEAVREAHRQT